MQAQMAQKMLPCTLLIRDSTLKPTVFLSFVCDKTLSFSNYVAVATVFQLSFFHSAYN